ncbi:unnamed protein product [Enterobius vermicularis]|uniref:Saposin A-type domain-containing protein n=1 Tax=Enterobius vermicularis TaxID=51028 RepID=A0A0N4UXI1_ENTVE|nr:unnamed protein product [Enterobius vermicularis]
MWCDSPQSARQCDVIRQCERHWNSKTPVKLTLIYEALCPFCQKFITQHLGSLYEEFRNNIELELIPWGNSRFMKGGTIVCDHGPNECKANKLQSCVLDTVKIRHALPFIVCLERSLTTNVNTEKALQHCSGFVRNNYRKIRRCFDTDRGYQLQIQAARKTASVRPHPVPEVPYLLVNDYSPNTETNNLNIHAIRHLLKKWFRNHKRGSR